MGEEACVTWPSSKIHGVELTCVWLHVMLSIVCCGRLKCLAMGMDFLPVLPNFMMSERVFVRCVYEVVVVLPTYCF